MNGVLDVPLGILSPWAFPLASLWRCLFPRSLTAFRNQMRLESCAATNDGKAWVLTRWLKADASTVLSGEPVCELEEVQGVLMDLVADRAGTLHHLKAAGEAVGVGDRVGRID